MRATVEAFSLRLARPLRTAEGTIARRDGFVVRVNDGSHVGIGEATPLPGWTESLEDCERSLRAVTGSIDDPDGALVSLDGRPAARHGLSLALRDLDARRAGDPLYRSLGDDADDHPEAIPVNATVGDGGVEETADEARAAVEEGYPCVKVKVGARDPEEDATRLGRVAEAVDGAASLRADANGSLEAAAARRFLDGPAPLEYLEQPLPPADLEGHASLREAGTVALDEALIDATVSAVLAADAADVLVLKPMVLGGVDRAAEAARSAARSGVESVVSCTVDGAVARAGAVHLAAALGPARPCGLATANRLADDLAPDPVPVERGRVRVPDGPGLGVTLDG